MRYIDLDLVLEDPTAAQLIAAADAARARVAAAPPDQRKSVIAAERDKWVVFRAVFQALFGNKCWYTECENPGTDDDIDHFRPKGDLAEDDTHGGYWWEALNWRNFRLSSHRANRLRINPDTGDTHGKGDHFPLLVESDRCRLPADDIAREAPALLDPTNPDDPPFLSFNIDGTVDVSPKYQGDAEAIRRVDSSRVYLHLEWPKIKEGRQGIYRKILTRVNDGDAADERWKRGELGARAALRQAARDLIRWTQDREPYSRAAQSYVRVFRDRAWVESFVLPHVPAGS